MDPKLQQYQRALVDAQHKMVHQNVKASQFKKMYGIVKLFLDHLSFFLFIMHEITPF